MYVMLNGFRRRFGERLGSYSVCVSVSASFGLGLKGLVNIPVNVT